MSKKWYPILDYDLCTECDACFNKCSNGVYKKEGNRPIVVAPDNCVLGCRGCQNLCPVGDIQYAGDTGNTENKDCCCGESNQGGCCS
jgi:NAD-dependent dihydropyrimidine dehydrogenase PreA subunit